MALRRAHISILVHHQKALREQVLHQVVGRLVLIRRLLGLVELCLELSDSPQALLHLFLYMQLGLLVGLHFSIRASSL